MKKSRKHKLRFRNKENSLGPACVCIEVNVELKAFEDKELILY